MTRERVANFLNATMMNKTDFSRCVGISITMLHYYLKLERKISSDMEQRINNFIDDYIERIKSI